MTMRRGGGGGGAAAAADSGDGDGESERWNLDARLSMLSSERPLRSSASEDGSGFGAGAGSGAAQSAMTDAASARSVSPTR